MRDDLQNMLIDTKRFFQTQIMEEEAWRKDDIRQLVIRQLREALEKCEGLGYLAEQIEECCFRNSKSEQEYNDTLGKLPKKRRKNYVFFL